MPWRDMRAWVVLAVFASLVAAGPLSGPAQSSAVEWPANGHWYERVDVSPTAFVTWEQAQAAAVAEGGYLATITSLEENDFVVVNLGGEALRNCWLGGYETSDTVWHWVTGEPWSYTNWSTGEPDGWPGTWYQGLMFCWTGPIGDWYDHPRSGYPQAGYVVEWDLNPDTPGSLKGQVRRSGTTTNIAGAVVTAYRDSVAMGVAITDAKGLYQIDGLEPGTYVVVAGAPGYLRQTKPNITVDLGSITYVNFSLQVSAELRGQVKDAQTDEPLAGIVIDVFQSATWYAGGITQPPWGVYDIATDLPAGTCLVRAAKEGYIRVHKYVDLVPGQTSYVNFSLMTSGRIKGQVKDQVSGTPLVGATVTASAGGTTWCVGYTTSPYGVYDLNRNLAAGYYTVAVSAAGYQSAQRTQVFATPGSIAFCNFALSPN